MVATASPAASSPSKSWFGRSVSGRYHRSPSIQAPPWIQTTSGAGDPVAGTRTSSCSGRKPPGAAYVTPEKSREPSALTVGSGGGRKRAGPAHTGASVGVVIGQSLSIVRRRGGKGICALQGRRSRCGRRGG